MPDTTTHPTSTIPDDPTAPTARVSGVVVSIPRGEAITAYSDQVSCRVAFGAPLAPTLTIAAATPADMVHLLRTALRAVDAASPDVLPELGPDPVLLEARDILRFDALPALGVLPAGEVLELGELGQTEIRAARRHLDRSLDALDAVIDGEVAGTLTTAVA